MVFAKRAFLIIFIATVFFTNAVFSVSAQTKIQIPLNAFVSNSDGTTIKDGQYEIRFALYTKDREISDPYPSNTDQRVWEETQSVNIFGGVLNTELAATKPFPSDINFTQTQYYLGVRIGTDAEMAPRKKISPDLLALDSYKLNGKTTGIGADNIPVLNSKGQLEASLIPSITKVGTVSTGTWEGDTLATSYGGTNSTSIGIPGTIAYSDGSAYSFTAQGIAGQVLLSNGDQTPSWGSLGGNLISPNSIDFSELKDTLTLDNDLNIIQNGKTITIGKTFISSNGELNLQGTLTSENLNITNSANLGNNLLNITTTRVGIGTTSPTKLLDVNGDANISGAITATSLIINGQATLGTSGQNVTINSNLIPNNTGLNLGSSSNHWANLYADNLAVGTLDVQNANVSGTSSQFFTLNSIATSETPMGLRFYKGTTNDYASFVWNNVSHDFSLYAREDINQLGNLTVGTISATNFVGSISGGTLNGNTIIAGTGTLNLGANSLTITANTNLNQSLLTTSSPTFSGLTISSMTQGSIPFIGAQGLYSQDNANLFWDSVNKNLGIGTNLPGSMLTIGAYNAGTSSSGFKQSLFSTDNMQLSQLEGGAYFGRVGVKEQQLALNNHGNTWVAKDSSRNWYSIAMSSDGKIQTAAVYNGQIYVSNDYGNIWTAKDSSRNWKGVAMSSDGKIQTAVVYGGQIYVSNDYGNTWIAKDSARAWFIVAMSSDGKIQTVTVSAGFDNYIYVSADYGNTWVAKDSSRGWYGVAMSSDGKIQTATVFNGQIYISTDYGNTWNAKDSNRSWWGVAMSSDGKIQTAFVSSGGQVYVSVDYGNTWNAKDSDRNWRSVAMSSDGRIQTAVVYNGQIYTSINYGDTWNVKGGTLKFWSVAMSSDGKIQTAIVTPGYIYVSNADSYLPSGNFGIGTATPTSLLSVGASSQFQVDSNGAITAIAGYTQTAGNFAMSGTGTFATGTGTVSLNGATTIAANQNFTMASGTGTYLQTYTGVATAKTITANSLTSGNILSLSSTSTAAAAGNTGLNIAISGANATANITRYGLQSAVTATNATSGTNVAGYFSASGATTANYGLLVANGNTGLGILNPNNLLTVGAYNSGTSSSLFKQSLFSTDNMQLGQLEGGAYFGRVGIKEQQLALNNYGNTWVAKDSARSWSGIAMSSDGKIQTAVVNNGQIYISTDYGNTWTAKASVRNWNMVAMSSDGKNQSAVANSSQIYISNDYGNTWIAKDSARSWTGVDMSSDGKIQTAVDNSPGNIYVSIDYGNTWIAKDSARNWYGMAMSSDGKIQTTVVNGGQIYISNDYGNTWIAKDSARSWYGVAMSSDGKIQTSVVNNGQIYISTDYGNTWTAKDSVRKWLKVAINSDGKIQTAVVFNGGQIYVSIDYGNTWTAKASANFWRSIAINSDGKIQTAAGMSTQIYISHADSYLPAGNFALGTDSPSAQLHTTGTVRFASLGSAGANLTTDANGNVTASSDERLKNIAGTFNKGVEALMNISPIAYKWNTQSGLETKNTYYGFSAQNIQQSIPEAVGVDSKGFLTLSDRPILATVVNAIKEQQTQILTITSSQDTITKQITNINNQISENTLKTDSNINTIAQLQTSIDEQLKKVNNQFTNIEKTQTDSQQILANLQTQIDQIKNLTASTQIELLSAKTELNTQDISLLKQILGITQTSEASITLTGSLTANGINTPSITITNIDPKARTLGTETIKAGQTSILVETNIITPNTKIFTTIESNIPLAVSITNKIEKKSFEIKIPQIQTEDVLVNWWIVQE